MDGGWFKGAGEGVGGASSSGEAASEQGKSVDGTGVEVLVPAVEVDIEWQVVELNLEGLAVPKGECTDEVAQQKEKKGVEAKKEEHRRVQAARAKVGAKV